MKCVLTTQEPLMKCLEIHKNNSAVNLLATTGSKADANHLQRQPKAATPLCYQVKACFSLEQTTATPPLWRPRFVLNQRC
jgi:hypothetical protein